MAVINVGVGETYETWHAALASLGALTEDTTLRQVADTAPATLVAAGNTPLNGFKLTLESSVPHGGDPTVGWKSTSVTLGASVIERIFFGPGSIEVKDLHIAIDADGTPYGINLRLFNFSSIDVSVHDCIVTNTFSSPAGFGVRVAANETLAWNTDLYNLAVSGWSVGVYVTPNKDGDWRVENVTVLGAHYAFFVGGPVAGTAEFRNCIGQGASGAFASIADVSGYNNASVDATAADANWLAGSGNQTLITLNDEFVSQTINDADFLKLANTGVCHDGGSAPSIVGNTEGIRGTARPHGVLYSIGADESEYIPPPASSGGGSGGGGGLSSAILAAMAAGYR